MKNARRRQLAIRAPAALGVSSMLAACTNGDEAEGYEAAAARIRRLGPVQQGLRGAALQTELVRYATLAPSSHNTQCCSSKPSSSGRARGANTTASP
ncbi:MAG: hypothetical protein ABI574_08030 [Burkholderiales bacterium]